jgi:chromosome segregation ATPase
MNQHDIEKELEQLDRQRLEIHEYQRHLHRKRQGIEDAPDDEEQDEKQNEEQKQGALGGIHEEIDKYETSRREILARMKELNNELNKCLREEETRQAAEREKSGRDTQGTQAGVARKQQRVQG